MATVVEELKQQLDMLPVRDRAELASYLLERLDEPAWDPEADAAWQVELARREAEIKAGTARGTPAEEVFRRLQAKYR